MLRINLRKVMCKLINKLNVNLLCSFSYRNSKDNQENNNKKNKDIKVTKYLLNKINMKCQIVRSASMWSAGLSKTETSILNAYYKTIEDAKRYIYIESQFFISRAFNKDEEKYCEDVDLSEFAENL